MTAQRHVPVRRCVACRDAQPKRDLVRLVRREDEWRLDLAQRAGGRGTSVCRACALAATGAPGAPADATTRLKGFRRAFRQDAAAVTALLAPIASTLAATASALTTAPAVASAPVAIGEPDARPQPNGGMHG
ncbi:MAG: YlxR family protein [Trueperaceae bacterium]